MLIERVTADRLSVPLSSPYHLSLGTVTELALVFVRVRTDDGQTGYGEAATLEGYFDVGIDTVWSECTSLAGSVAGTTTAEAADAVAAADHSLITRSAFAAALEGVTGSPLGPVRAPVVGIASAREGVEATVDAVAEQVTRGHEVIKIKIGFDPRTDGSCLRAVTDAAPDSVRFRVDANQGYSVADTREFLEKGDTSQLELIEQPLPVGRLEGHATLRTETEVPLMLDEEISGPGSLREVISAGAADMVKFKQMKQGGPAAVRSLAATAREHGLRVVLGNGVQSDVGCLQEARLWESLGLHTVGEFNGWHKQQRSLIDPAPRLEGGMCVWEDGPIQPDVGTIAAFSERQSVVGE